jgi:N-acetyl-anhydromuramyl-L-alanine amidase AmpD
MKVSTARLRKHLDASRLELNYVKGWDSPRIDPYKGGSDFQGVLLHHTAGTNSLNFIVNTNRYAPVRACHFLIARDGTVHVVSGVGAYHAGEGGPYSFTRTTTIPRNGGNSRLYGIEIESLGTSAKISGSIQGMTVEQVVATARLCAVLLHAMRPGPLSFKAGRVIRHRDWAPRRKVDTRQALEWWRRAVRIALKEYKDPHKAEDTLRDFVRRYPDGNMDQL